MNRGEATGTMATLDPNSLEKHKIVDTSLGQASSYYAPSTGSETVSWITHRVDNSSMGNGIYPTSALHPDQHTEPLLRNIQNNSNATSIPSTSSSEAANIQVYSSYAAYPNTDPYGYSNTGYAGYYTGYQQQPNQSYPQSVGAYQSTGAPHQPLSSFQNTGPANYSSTYYNTGDYQTTGGYHSGGYNNQNQTNSWHQGNYANYTNPYPSYTPESNGANSSSSTASSLQYQQHYKQWADYYNQTEVSCAPGTENISVPSTVNRGCPVPGVAGGYSSTKIQQPAPFIPSWRPESSTSDIPPVQPCAVISSAHDGYWNHGTPGFQNQIAIPIQPNLQKPLDSNPAYGNFQDQQNSDSSQGLNVHYPATTHQVHQNYHTSLQPVSQPVIPLDSRRVSVMQIPTNPRIATNLTFGLPKADKDSSARSPLVKPAYISVQPPKPNDKPSADSILKPGMFPKSLRGYVERALARCKDDAQMAACQAVMKEVITKATADGTLNTRDWDIEPLFPIPNGDTVNNENVQSSPPVSSLLKSRRSPSRRSKSRWEPISEEKLVEKPASLTPDVKFGGWFNLSEGNKFSTGKLDKENINLKFPSSDQKATNKNTMRPAKKQRLGDGLSGGDNGGASSDSDMEQSLTAYYAGAMALADSSEERKRRENRSKRFEKSRGNPAANNHFIKKNVGAGLYTRRATASVLSKNFEEGSSLAVEDIDWDALTVKGTCQEIEKRYLRLTSAPDPATVRPEDVLEKALLMVINSPKNYLYKCDQLKSIRQDLTVQRIRNELTVKVYETHARLAIEVGDLSEFNQCQSQLKTLYAEGNKGCHMEFSAYNLLCVILHSNNNRDLLSAMSRLSVEARNDEAVKHALAVRAAVTSGNYVLFFRLYKTAPNLNTCLMDLYVEKMRYAAVKCISRSYRPTLPVMYIAQVLGFRSISHTVEASDEKDTDGLEECVDWLKAHGACITTDNSGEMFLDTKASTSSLYMPEPEDAVSHGDATLAVNDFLTRTTPS